MGTEDNDKPVDLNIEKLDTKMIVKVERPTLDITKAITVAIKETITQAIPQPPSPKPWYKNLQNWLAIIGTLIGAAGLFYGIYKDISNDEHKKIVAKICKEVPKNKRLKECT